jgi:hypothetical protein
LHKPGGIPVTKAFRLSDARDAGQATPEALMQTFFWALAQGATNRMTQLVVGTPTDDPQKDQALLEQAIQHLNKDSADMRADTNFSPESAEIQLFEVQPDQNNDQWVVGGELRPDGSFNAGKLLSRQTSDGWKLVLGANGQPVEVEFTSHP